MSYSEYLYGRGQEITRSINQDLYALSSMSTPAKLGVVGAGLAILLAIKLISAAFHRPLSSKSSIPTKAQRSQAMKREFNSVEKGNESVQNLADLKRQGEPTMEIAQLWVYPIKALRGCQVPTATLTPEGFTHDRKFVLLKDLEKTPRQVQHMAVTKFPNVCLFHTSIQGNILTVTYRPPGAAQADGQELKIPLEPPNFDKSERIEVNMHSSPTIAFDMGAKYNQWFSDIFGFKVILAYWGGNPRQVLGNLPGKPSNVSSKPRTPIFRILNQVPIISRLLRPDDGVIAFNDCAPYLVITEESTADVTSRLPDGITMDMTKFRANIILRKSPAAFDEDFWGQLIFGDDTRIILTGNCGRCVSLNIDYASGTSGAGRDGQVLKLLSSDRRVDPGMKYSPIFGRYGFVSRRSEGKVLRVGEEVVVGKRNAERTRFYWPGISSP